MIVRLNECYSVPDSILSRMRHLDAALRLHWDAEKTQVRVERKISRGKPLDPSLVSRRADYEMARDGYAPWLSFDPTEENYRKLLYTIEVMDMWKRGGWKAIADTLESDEAQEKEEKRRSWKSDVHLMACEMFRHLNTPKTGWRPYEVKAD